MLSSVAKETGTWLVGGAHSHGTIYRDIYLRIGTIPEREVSTGKLYNTATVYSPQGLVHSHYLVDAAYLQQ